MSALRSLGAVTLLLLAAAAPAPACVVALLLVETNPDRPLRMTLDMHGRWHVSSMETFGESARDPRLGGLCWLQSAWRQRATLPMTSEPTTACPTNYRTQADRVAQADPVLRECGMTEGRP